MRKSSKNFLGHLMWYFMIVRTRYLLPAFIGIIFSRMIKIFLGVGINFEFIYILIIFLGGFLNFMVVFSNGRKMPVLIKPIKGLSRKIVSSPIHFEYQNPSQVKLHWLTDRYVLSIKHPFKKKVKKIFMVSIGDMLLALGFGIGFSRGFLLWVWGLI